jgi:23S rRNA (cytidine1920-2'-O)/16S rRNA (cytidine1409-2'-O)-methyltransferase
MADIRRLRLDRLLVERGMAISRARARSRILAGFVRCAGRVIDKPAAMVEVDAEIELTGQDNPWVSRGGLKLDAALEYFGIKPVDACCLDIGASTGGFTDVLLSKGAARVFAVDVGHGQLVERVSSDPRVVVLERTDARSITPELIGTPIDLVVCDVSFISIRKAIPPALALVKPGGQFLGLVKPQFEVGPGKVGGGGVVRDATLLDHVSRDLVAWLDAMPPWKCNGIMDSPVTGGDGNREFLLSGTKMC